MAPRSTLPEEELEAARKALAELAELHKHASGDPNQSAIGQKLGMSQQAVGIALNVGRIGPDMARALARSKGFEDVGQLVRYYRGDEPAPAARVLELDEVA